ncbi:HdeD family acid-resistance protein [Bdellovibrio sp. HCB209]|uniref:HdeD family acid-resistance protein n=1 Tax=Bdellovibrio sp. HCB209 TaxID=3394354 RepID=UPI0039B4F8DC
MDRKSGRLIINGGMCAFVGVIALAVTLISTSMATLLSLAVILTVSGIAQITFGITERRTGQMWPHVGLGSLSLVTAILIARDPYVNSMFLPLLVGFMLLAGGFTKVIGAFVERSTGWGFFAVNGITSLALASLLLYNYPVSSYWAVGTFIGLDLIVNGLSMVGLGYAIRKRGHDVVRSMNSLLPDNYDEIEQEYFHKQNEDLEKDHEEGDGERQQLKENRDKTRPTLH